MPLPDLDFSGDQHPRLVVLARIEYRDADGVERVARWMGPRSKYGSALTVAGLEDGTTELRQYLARLDGVDDDADLGSLTNAFQAVSEMRLTIEVGHRDDADGLMRDAQLGRWSYRRARVWVGQIEARGGCMRVTRAREIFGGRVSRKGVERVDLGRGAALRLRLTDSLLPEETLLPTTRMPSAAEIANGETPYARTGTGSTGDTAWHPGSASGTVEDAYDAGPNAGRHIGPHYGRHDSVATRFTAGTPATLKELAFYGAQSGPIGSHYYYFHVSPQLDCFVLNDSVKALWFEDASGNVHSLETVNPSTSTKNVNIRCFNNTDPASGPVGTNLRLLLDDADAPDGSGGLSGGGFQGATGARCWAICFGPGGGVRDTSAPDTTAGLALSGTIEALTQAPLASIQQRDDEVLADLFDLAGLAAEVDPGALATYDTEAPDGRSGTQDYRRIGCAIGAEPSDDPPKLREVVGELAMIGAGDVVVTYTATGRKIAPRRRRPNSKSGAADHVVRLWDLYQGRDVYSARPRVQQDPRADYATEVEVRAPDRWVPGLAVGGTAAAVNIASAIDGPSRTITDAAEEVAAGSVVPLRVTLKRWLPQIPPAWISGDEDPAFTDAARLMAGALTQPQRYVEAKHGWRALLFELGDTIRYEGIDGLHVAEVGQIRKIRRDYLEGSATITSIHLPDGFDEPTGDEDGEG